MDNERYVANRTTDRDVVVDEPVRERGRVDDDDRGRFSIGATFLGWCVASFLSILFAAIVAGILGGAAANVAQDGATQGELQNLGIAGLIGLLVATFAAYLVGGYAAGRIAHWDGAKHGAIVPAWAILFAILAAIIGAGLGANFVNAVGFGGFNVNVDPGALTGAAIVSIILMLAAMFGGAILGGMLGERSDERYLGYIGRERVVRRGRPF